MNVKGRKERGDKLPDIVSERVAANAVNLQVFVDPLAKRLNLSKEQFGKCTKVYITVQVTLTCVELNQCLICFGIDRQLTNRRRLDVRNRKKHVS